MVLLFIKVKLNIFSPLFFFFFFFLYKFGKLKKNQSGYWYPVPAQGDPSQAEKVTYPKLTLLYISLSGGFSQGKIVLITVYTFLNR